MVIMVEGRHRLFRIYFNNKLMYEDPIFNIMMRETYRLGRDQRLTSFVV